MKPIPQLEKSLLATLAKWSKREKLPLTSLQINLTIDVNFTALPESSPLVGKAVRTDEELADEDWKTILALPWKDSVRVLLEEKQKLRDPIVTREDIKPHWLFTDNLAQSANIMFRNHALLYRFCSIKGAYGPIKLCKVKIRAHAAALTIK